MSIVNVVAVVVLLGASGALAGSLVLRLLEPLLVPRMRQFVPEVRVRWLAALTSLPLCAGAIAVAISFGPCLQTFALGLPDACLTHAEPGFFFCLRTPMPNQPLAWLLASAVLLFPALRTLRTSVSFVRAQRAIRLLKQVSRWDAAQGVWVAPGAVAMVAGFPRAEIFVGEQICESVSVDTLGAIVAHEQAHKKRQDIWTKLITRSLSSCFFGHGLRARWLDELDLAIEQACDAAAANELKDPVLVARSLVDLVGVNSYPADWACAFGSADHLEARVRALCEPQWQSSRTVLGASLVLAASLLAVCTLFDPALHELSEAAFGHLFGG